MDVRAIDLFCGAGGFSLGFQKAGAKVLLGIEKEEFPAKSYSENFRNSHVLLEDIRRVHSRKILEEVGEVDLVIGSPPCEPFTSANASRRRRPIERLYFDETGNLVLHFIRIVGDLRPKAFVMENVVPIMEGELKWALRKEFERIGYEVYFNVLRAEDHGTPSRRNRVFISNFKISPKKTPGPKVWEAIKDLPHPGYGPPNHDPVSVSGKKARKIPTLPWEKGLVAFRGAGGRLIWNWIRLHPEKYAPPIMGLSRFIHPYEDRLLTPREHARLMGYPDSHIFYGPKDSQYNQVGESVPPTLAEAVARDLLSKIEGV